MFSPNNMAAYVQFIRSQVGLTAPTENRFKCALCDRSYPKKRGLKNHMVIHEGRFECQECGKCCRSQYDLDNHVLTHSGAKLFSCSKCDSSFARSYSFHKHYKVCFGEDPENYPFECETCHEKFRSSRGLKNHQVLHDGNLQCQSCRIRFKSKAELLSHRQIHLDRKSYACSTCFYHTENKSHLSRHNKTCKGKKSVPRRDFISGCEEDCGVTVKQEEYSDLILPEGPRQIHGPDVKKECDLDDYMLLEYSGKVEEQAEGMAEGSRDKAGDDAIWRDQFHALLGNSLDYNLPVPKPEPYDPSFDEPTTIEEPSTSAQVFHQFPTEITDSRRKTHASVQEVLSIGDPQLGGKKEIKLELHEALLRPAPTSSLSIFKFPVRPSLSSHQLWTPAAKLPTTIDIVGEKAKELGLDLEHVQKLEPRWVLS